MNKKAQDFLNVTEMIVAAFCLFVSFYLLISSTTTLKEKATGAVLDSRVEYQINQLLRTLTQTTVMVDGKPMQFAELANKYFELFDTDNQYNSNQELGVDTEVSQRKELKSIYRDALLQASNDYFKPYVDELPSLKDTRLKLILKENGKYVPISDRSFNDPVLLRLKRTKFTKNAFEPVTILIPAHFQYSLKTEGTYHIELCYGEDSYANGCEPK